MEQPLGDEIEELLELLVGFAGKSRDERCAQGDVGHRGLDALDEGAKRCGIPSAVHGPKDRFAHVLQGNVQIRANVLAGRHDGEQLVGCALGLQVHDAEPRVGVRLGQRVDEPREVAAVGKVGAPASGVLGDEHDLPGAGGDLALDVLGDLLVREAVVAPANVGDGAIGAEAVAAIGYLHVGERPALPFRRLAPNGRYGKGDPQSARHHFRDIVLATAGHKRRRLRQLRGQVVPVAGRHTAGDDEDGTALIHFGQGSGLEDGIDALLGGRLDERAGVHDDGVGAGRLLGHGEAGFAQAPRHGGRVHLVLRAPHRDEADGGRRAVARRIDHV